MLSLFRLIKTTWLQTNGVYINQYWTYVYVLKYTLFSILMWRFSSESWITKLIINKDGFYWNHISFDRLLSIDYQIYCDVYTNILFHRYCVLNWYICRCFNEIWNNKTDIGAQNLTSGKTWTIQFLKPSCQKKCLKISIILN